MEEPSFIFSSGPIELKEEGENFFVEGYISTSDLDLVNDIVTKECILDMGEQMKTRTIKMDLEHESFRGDNLVELEINKTLIPAAKIDDFLIDKKGMKVRAMLNKHVGRFNELKNSIKDGFLDAFSIAFIPTKARVEERAGTKIRLLDKINLLNVAFTGNPVNTQASMTNMFAKSLEFLKEQEKAKPKRPPRRVFPNPDDEEEEEEDKKKKYKKEKKTKVSMSCPNCGHKIMDAEKKNNDHLSDNKIKLKEGIKMSEEEDNKETEEKEESNSKEKPETEEKADEGEEESETEENSDDEESKEETDAEEKADEEESKEETETEDKARIKKLEKDLMEVKNILKQPLLKSKIGTQDKSKNFETKSLNPLDMIA